MKKKIESKFVLLKIFKINYVVDLTAAKMEFCKKKLSCLMERRQSFYLIANQYHLLKTTALSLISTI